MTELSEHSAFLASVSALPSLTPATQSPTEALPRAGRWLWSARKATAPTTDTTSTTTVTRSGVLRVRVDRLAGVSGCWGSLVVVIRVSNVSSSHPRRTPGQRWPRP